MHPMHEVLVSQGYKLIEDAWAAHGRLTYIHDDDADRQHLAAVTRAIGAKGWLRPRDELRTYLHPGTKEIIEVEPGGAETSGHFPHLMKADSL
jgi:hypothetical protein